MPRPTGGSIDQFIYDPAGTINYAANQDGNNITYRFTYDAIKRKRWLRAVGQISGFLK